MHIWHYSIHLWTVIWTLPLNRGVHAEVNIDIYVTFLSESSYFSMFNFKKNNAKCACIER